MSCCKSRLAVKNHPFISSVAMVLRSGIAPDINLTVLRSGEPPALNKCLYLVNSHRLLHEASSPQLSSMQKYFLLRIVSWQELMVRFPPSPGTAACASQSPQHSLSGQTVNTWGNTSEDFY